MTSIDEVLPLLKELLPVQVIRDWMQEAGVRFYERLFTPAIVIWCLIYQRLSADHSLDTVVSHVSAGGADPLDERDRAPVSSRIKSESTAAYSKARTRMPLAVVQRVASHLAQAGQQCLEDDGLWHGQRVALLDGTTVMLRPEGDIVEHYGQTRNQHGVGYWVVMRIVAAFCLHTGMLLTAADGPRRESEQSLAHKVLADFAPGTLCVGDRNFGVFSVAQAARHYGVSVLLRLTDSRARSLRRRTVSPGEDSLIQWAPSRDDRCNAEMSADPVVGRLIHVRLERDGFRVVHLRFFTTLLDAICYPVDELVALYGRRWHVELDLRYVKTTLDMELLTAKSAQMAQKELWAGLAAYNIIRIFMTMAAREAALLPLALSFTKCWRRIQSAVQALCSHGTRAPGQPLQLLLTRLAKCRLQKRIPFRVEPRAVRKRSVQYTALSGPRDEARQRARQQLAEPVKS
jgi:hypothetical protein